MKTKVVTVRKRKMVYVDVEQTVYVGLNGKHYKTERGCKKADDEYRLKNDLEKFFTFTVINSRKSDFVALMDFKDEIAVKNFNKIQLPKKYRHLNLHLFRELNNQFFIPKKPGRYIVFRKSFAYPYVVPMSLMEDLMYQASKVD